MFLLANVGKIGIKIPKPIKSINTVKKITANEAFPFFLNFCDNLFPIRVFAFYILT